MRSLAYCDLSSCCQLKYTAIEYDIISLRVYTLVCYGMPLPAFGNLTVSMGQQKNVDAVFSTIAQDNVPTTLSFLD